MVEIIEVNTEDKAQVRQFLQLPYEIYKDVPQWVPALAMDAVPRISRAQSLDVLSSMANIGG